MHTFPMRLSPKLLYTLTETIACIFQDPEIIAHPETIERFRVWGKIPREWHVYIVACFMCCLGVVACTLLLTFMRGGPFEGIFLPVQDQVY